MSDIFKDELLRLMPVRNSTHPTIAGPFICRWCSAVVKLADGTPVKGEAHEEDCFAALHLGRPVRKIYRMDP